LDIGGPPLWSVGERVADCVDDFDGATGPGLLGVDVVDEVCDEHADLGAGQTCDVCRREVVVASEVGQ
jgi:hypothetical protein